MTSLKDFFKNESPAVLFMNFHVCIALTLKRSIRLLCLFFYKHHWPSCMWGLSRIYYLPKEIRWRHAIRQFWFVNQETRGPVSNFDRIEFLVAVRWSDAVSVLFPQELLFHKLQEFRAWIETSIVLQPLWRLFFYVRRPRRRLSSWTATFGWWPRVGKEVTIGWEGGK